MPWELSAEVDARFLRIVRLCLAVFLLFGIIMPYLPLPEFVKKAVEEPAPRLATLIFEVKKTPPKPVAKPKAPEPIKQVKKQKPVAKKPAPPKVVKATPRKVKPAPVKPKVSARKQAEQAGLLAMKDALADLKQASEQITDPSLFFRSRQDTNKDYFNRALGVMVGIFGNVKKVSVYFATAKDDQGELLDGSKHNYTLTFAADNIPPAKNFWSYTMYKLPQRWLVDNPINRYSIGSATPGLKKAADGSITLYFQAKSPGKDKESNWLPAPEGPFWPILRTYGPGQTILDKTYKLPPVVQLK